MAKSVSVILDELALGIEELRAVVAPRAGRARSAAPPNEAGDIEQIVSGSDDIKEICTTVERHVIDRVMRTVRGNQSKGAQLLKISRGSLIAKLKLYRIEDYRHLKRTQPVSARSRALGRSDAAPGARGGARRRGRPANQVLGPKASAPAKKKVRRTSPKLKALRVMQGKFLGALRGLKPRQREQIKKVRAEKGYEAAIKAAASLGK